MKKRIIVIIIILAALIPTTPVVALPATVATSTTEYAVTPGFQCKGFYAEGLFWNFYSDGTNAGWEFSADGTTWDGAFTSIGVGTSGSYFSVWFDGAYVHYIITRDYDLFYRRGTPVNDGSINWSAVEQTVYDGGDGDKYTSPCITVDSAGYAWIGARSDQLDGDDFPVAIKNADNDGTWTTDFVYELSAIDAVSWKVCPVPLTDGKVYMIYCLGAHSPLGRLYDAGWGAEENDLADFSISGNSLFSAVADGDDIHFVYTKAGPDQIRYNNRTFGVGWMAADVLVQASVEADTGPVLSFDTDTNNLYCFWTHIDTDYVYYKAWNDIDGWDAGATDWIDESIDDFKRDRLISSFYQDYSGYIGVLYVTGLADPYNVRFAFLDLLSPNNDACDSDALFNRGEAGWVNITVSDPQGVANIDSVDIQVNTMGDFESFTLRWTQGGAFTEQSDPDEICTLDAVNSTAINLNATAVRVCYHFTMTGGADGACAVKVTTTDDDANTDIDTYAAEFNYQTIGWNPIGDLIDSAFALFGISGYMASATAFINAIKDHFIDSLINLAVLINLQFQVIWQVWGWATGWFTRMITAVLNFGNQLRMILNGTHPLLAGTVDIWNYFDFASAGQSVFDVAPVFFIIYWIDSMGKRARTQGSLQVLYGDLSAFANVFAYFMGAFSTLIGFIEGKISWLLNALT